MNRNSDLRRLGLQIAEQPQTCRSATHFQPAAHSEAAAVSRSNQSVTITRR